MTSEQRYGAVAKFFHWTIGLGIIFMLGFGLYFDTFEVSNRGVLIGWHKSIGITILALAALRILWRLTHKYPKALDTHSNAEKIGSRVAHFVLYGLMILLPLSGWYMSSAAGYPVNLFGWGEIPSLMEKSKEWGSFFNQSHETLAYICIAVIALHFAGALKHHYFDKDNTLRRMWPFAKVK